MLLFLLGTRNIVSFPKVLKLLAGRSSAGLKSFE